MDEREKAEEVSSIGGRYWRSWEECLDPSGGVSEGGQPYDTDLFSPRTCFWPINYEYKFDSNVTQEFT
ncbi:hypothetical protein, partial [Klebsiella pneumoniae]|uniref:hypothetical protein n=1 Tax=Klebsiella pneumoniae TaxID=573 RepID=UPI0040554552